MPSQNNTENNRKYEKNRIKEEIRLSSKYNDNDSASLARFRGLANDDYASKQVEKLANLIADRKVEIDKLTERLTKLETGELDTELTESIKTTTREVNQKNNEHLEKVKIQRQIKQEDADFGKMKFKQECQADKVNKEYFYKSSLKHFDKAEETVPEYMTRELTNMPNNHAYVWKNVYFWGKRSPDHRRMSQATHNQKGFKTIEKWDDNYFYVYEKHSRCAEKLISKTKRKIMSV